MKVAISIIQLCDVRFHCFTPHFDTVLTFNLGQSNDIGTSGGTEAANEIPGNRSSGRAQGEGDQ